MTSVLKANTSKDVHAYLNYVYLGRGKQFKENVKNGTTRAVAAYCSAGKPSDFARITKKYQQISGSRVQLQTDILSFSRDSMDPNSKRDIAEAVELSIALNQRLYPNSPAILVVCHTDGKSHCVHTHCAAVNFDLKSNSIIRKNRSIFAMRKESDKLMQQYGLPVLHPGDQLADSMTTKRNKEKHGEAWCRKHDFDTKLKIAISSVVKNRKIESFDAFEGALKKVGVKVETKEHEIEKTGKDKNLKPVKQKINVVGLRYSMMDADTSIQKGKPRRRGRKARRLNKAWEYNRLQELFAANRQLAHKATQIAEQEDAKKQAQKAADKKKRRRDKRRTKRREKRRARAEALAAALAKAKASAVPVSDMHVDTLIDLDLPDFIKKSKDYRQWMKTHDAGSYTEFASTHKFDSVRYFEQTYRPQVQNGFIDRLKKEYGENSKLYFDPKTGHLAAIEPAKKAKQEFGNKASAVMPSKPEKRSMAKSEPVAEVQASAAKTKPAIKIEPAANSTEQSQEGVPEKPEQISENAMPTQPSQPDKAKSFDIKSWYPARALRQTCEKPVILQKPIDSFYAREEAAMAYYADNLPQIIKLPQAKKSEASRKWPTLNDYSRWTRHTIDWALKSKDSRVRQMAEQDKMAVDKQWLKGYLDDDKDVREIVRRLELPAADTSSLMTPEMEKHLDKIDEEFKV